MKAWAPVLDRIEQTTKDANAMSDVQGLLARLVAAYGTNAVGRMLGTNGSLVTRWKQGVQPISPLMKKRIIDIHDVLNRALQVYPSPYAERWLVGHSPRLNGARPIDVLVARGVADVIAALESIDQGAYV
jgi:uncharacterized protein (DUF2384 family)